MTWGILDELALWTAASQDERERVARDVEMRLPRGFRHEGLSTHEHSGQRHTLARFSHEGRVYALLPGIRDRMLGYAPEGLEIDETARAALAESIDADADASLRGFLERLVGETTPRRRASLPPFLIAERAEYGQGRKTAATVTETLAPEGFRLPSEDEWEYACSAGRDTFFKWGARMPCEAFPPGNDHEGMVPFEGATSANAFGLHIATDPYKWEFCAELDVFRGGDGGEAWCGGAGILAIWRALGTPYRHVVHAREGRNPFTGKMQTFDTRRSAGVRRVMTLPALP